MGGLFLHKKTADFSWFYCNAESKFGKKRVQTFLKKKAAKEDEYALFYNRVYEMFSSSKKFSIKSTTAVFVRFLIRI